MSEFEGMALQGDTPSAGVLLVLRSPSECDAVASGPNDGLQVEVREGVKAVIIRGLDASSHETVMAVAPEHANRALDIFSLEGGTHLALDDVWATHVAWWPGATGMVVRFWCAATATMRMRGRVEVRDADGNLVVAEAAKTPRWQESMRYYRMSELTDDLFDAFRNVYLALESLLSVLEPIRPRGAGGFEREEEWFKRALRTASGLVDLADFVVNVTGNPVHDIYEELHNQVRHRVFHAKNGRGPYLPQELATRAHVAEAHARYRRLYLALAEKHFGATVLSGGTSLSLALMRQMGLATFNGAEVAITSDTATAGADDRKVSPNDHPTATLGVVEFTDPRGEEHSAVLASCAVADVIDDVPAIGRLATVGPDGGLGVVVSTDGRFDLHGFETLEVVFSVRVAGRQARKVAYQM